jgi:LysM repeat protein
MYYDYIVVVVFVGTFLYCIHYIAVGTEELGHVGVVTCLLHDGQIIYSGSIDESIIAWDGLSRKLSHRFLGHEGTIVALAVETTVLVSSGSDNTIRLWEKHTAKQLRVVHGHSKSVLSIEIGSTWMCTGSADEEVRIWTISRTQRGFGASSSSSSSSSSASPSISAAATTTNTLLPPSTAGSNNDNSDQHIKGSRSTTTLQVRSTHRLQGHECTVTCVRFGQVEVISGDVKGRIFIWWVETGVIIRRCQVHQGSIKAIQFDSVHIVSGSCDNTISITDIATGEVLQTLRGHDNHVLALAFDTERIVSISGDNTIRYWSWGKTSAPEDKVHVLDRGETLIKIAKQYEITINDLMRWNGINDVRQCYPGMKLIVRKAYPEQLTKAELALQQRDQRIEAASKLAKTVKKNNNNKSTLASSSLSDIGDRLKDYNRVHKNATDIDSYSLGNRMFYRDKKDIELFPDKIDPNLDPYSISSRLKLDEERKGHAQRMLKSGLDQSIENANDYEDREAYEWAVKTGSKIRPRFIISSVNEGTWGHVADSLAMVMLNMLVEYESYSVVLEQKRQLRSKISLIGRINEAQLQELRLKEKERLAREEDEELNQLDAKLKRLEGIGKEEIDNMSYNDDGYENDGGHEYMAHLGAHLDIDKVIKIDHSDDDKGDITVNVNNSKNNNNDNQYQSDNGNNRRGGSSLARSKDKKSKAKNKYHRRSPKKQKDMNIDNTNNSIIDNSNDHVDGDDDEGGDTHHHHLEIVHGTHDPVEDNSVTTASANGIHHHHHHHHPAEIYNSSGGDGYDRDDGLIIDDAAASSVDKQSSSSSSSSSQVSVQQHAVITLPSIVEKNRNSHSSDNSSNNNSSSNSHSHSRRSRGRSGPSKGATPTEEMLPPIVRTVLS